MKSHESELLLPVGNMEMCLAAIHNGADAIYVGMPGFNARGRSKDHELVELQEMIETCHLYGVKVNLAFNIVIFEDEFNEVVELLAKVLPLKPDALIVQDLGLARLVKKMAPKQVIHASTQMTVTNQDAMKFLSKLDFKRFVLGRENSLEEIKLIAQALDYELEVFVHGALCVAYSGQCFTSESIGGRSANRGQCAQSCRLSYEMFVDGKRKDLVDRDYLVSPKDLCGIAEIPSLLEAGVKSFKVEGRLKGPEYVAAAGRVYKPILKKKHLTNDEINNGKAVLSQTYSRGFFSGWLHGVNHQELVEGTYNEHRGVEFGVVQKVGPKSLSIKLNSEFLIKNGDGVLIHYLKNNKRCEAGGRVYAVKNTSSNSVEIELSKEFKLEKELVGGRIFKNSDPELLRTLNANVSDKNLKKRIALSGKIEFSDHQRIKLFLSDGKNQVSGETDSVIEFSKNEYKNKNEVIKECLDEITAISGTVFKLDRKDLEVMDNTSKTFWIHQKELKNLRRTLCDELTRIRSKQTVDLFDVSENQASVHAMKDFLDQTKFQSVLPATSSVTVLNVLLREKDQVIDFLKSINEGYYSFEELKRIQYVILDFEYGKNYEECLKLLKQHGIKVGIATTRILKPGEYHHLKVLNRLLPDAILVRNLGAFYFLKNELNFKNPLLGDFSLNVTNHLSAQFLLDGGFHSLALSYDLTGKRITELLANTDAAKMEVTIHQYMPSFHMEHCVFAAFLSNGKSYKDCGKPCEKHVVELVDQFGVHHHIRADQECRNTMFNATSQSAASFYSDWNAKNLGSVRFEAMYEKGLELNRKISGLLGLINGNKAADELIKDLNLIEKYGISSAVLTKDKVYKDRKKGESQFKRL